MHRLRRAALAALLLAEAVLGLSAVACLPADAALATATIRHTITVRIDFTDEVTGETLTTPIDAEGNPLEYVLCTAKDEDAGTEYEFYVRASDGWVGNVDVPELGHAYSISYALPESTYQWEETYEALSIPEPDEEIYRITLRAEEDISTENADGNTYLIGMGPNGTSGFVAPTDGEYDTQYASNGTPKRISDAALVQPATRAQWGPVTYEGDEARAFASAASTALWQTRYVGVKDGSYLYEFWSDNGVQERVLVASLTNTRSSQGPVYARDAVPPSRVQACNIAGNSAAMSFNGSQLVVAYNVLELIDANSYPSCTHYVHGTIGGDYASLIQKPAQATDANMLKLWRFEEETITVPSEDVQLRETYTISAVRVFDPPETGRLFDSGPAAAGVGLGAAGLAACAAMLSLRRKLDASIKNCNTKAASVG